MLSQTPLKAAKVWEIVQCQQEVMWESCHQWGPKLLLVLKGWDWDMRPAMIISSPIKGEKFTW